MSKVYVDVDAHFDTMGNVIPTAIVWGDGTTYEIDKVLDMQKAASLKAGGMGLRYTVRIRNKRRYLFFEKGARVERWFVEGK